MKATIEAIDKALASAGNIKPESIESRAAIVHLRDAKRHLENRLKHAEKEEAAQAPAPEAPARPAVPPVLPAVPPRK